MPIHDKNERTPRRRPRTLLSSPTAESTEQKIAETALPSDPETEFLLDKLLYGPQSPETRLLTELKSHFASDAILAPGGWRFAMGNFKRGFRFHTAQIEAYPLDDVPLTGKDRHAPAWVGDFLRPDPGPQQTSRNMRLMSYLDAGISTVWIIDTLARHIEVYVLRNGVYARVITEIEPAVLSAPPFQAVEIALAPMWSACGKRAVTARKVSRLGSGRLEGG